MDRPQKRQVSYKLWIKDICRGNYIKEDELSPGYIKLNEKSVSRVNLIGNVVSKFKSEDNNYAYISIEDGTSAIRLKAWRDDTRILDGIDVGDIVLTIGRPRIFNEEVFINPEIIRRLDDPNWEIVRKIELLKAYGKPLDGKTSEVYNGDSVPQQTTESSRQKILSAIERFSTEEGVKIEKIISESGLSEEDAEAIINELLRDGEIYEPRPSWIRAL